MTSLARIPFFCSWSGGKDSCLALDRSLREGGDPRRLLTMMAEDGRRSRSHGLPRFLLEEQARQIGIPIAFRCASWENYETVFSAALREFRSEGIEAGVFGDIDIEDHRQWCWRVCAAAGLQAVHPLWQTGRRTLFAEFLRRKFAAVIIAVKAEALGPEWLGRRIDPKTVRELEKAGVDPSGEAGEYHTVAVDGPVFRSRIGVRFGEPALHDGYWFLQTASPSGDVPGETPSAGAAAPPPSAI
jgi:diphthine-ammonia ligase